MRFMSLFSNRTHPMEAIIEHASVPSSTPPALPEQSQSRIVDATITNHNRSSMWWLLMIGDAIHSLSARTKLCLACMAIGVCLIVCSLPSYTMLAGVAVCGAGVFGAVHLALNGSLEFMRRDGLISLVATQHRVLHTLLLRYSVLDVLDAIRHSRLGIPDFVLSQVLPLDEAERDLILERLPRVTKDWASTPGLLFLLPRTWQRVLLPAHLQRHREQDMDFASIADERVARFHSRSPSLSSASSSVSRSSSFSDLSAANESAAAHVPAVDQTKHDFEVLGKEWLRKHTDLTVDEDCASPQLFSLNAATADQAADAQAEQEQKESRHPFEVGSPGGIHMESPPLQPRTMATMRTPGSAPLMPAIAEEADMTALRRNEDDILSQSWIGRVGRLFGEELASGTRASGAGSKPIMKAVIDTRVKEMLLQVMSAVWKSPFSQVSDSQLMALFAGSATVLVWSLSRNARMRLRFVQNMKYALLMLLLAVAVVCFVELNIRRKSRMFSAWWAWLQRRWLFHSKHHRAVKHRKKSYQDLRSKPMMRMYTERSRSKMNLLQNIENRRRHSTMDAPQPLHREHRSSKFSRTLPVIQLNQESPQSVAQSAASSSLSTSADNRTPLMFFA